MAAMIALVFVRCDEMFYPCSQLRCWRDVSPNDGFVTRAFPDHTCGGWKGNPLRARNSVREARDAIAVFRVRRFYEVCAKWIVHCVRRAPELDHGASYTSDEVK